MVKRNFGRKMEGGPNPKRKAKLDPIVDDEDTEEREEREEKVEKKRVKKIERGEAADRSYPILEHNSTKIYLTSYEGYANNARFLQDHNIMFIVNVTKRKENFFEGRFLQRSIVAKNVRGDKATGDIQYKPQYYKLSIEDAGKDAKELYSSLNDVTAWIEESSLAWQSAEKRKDLSIVEKYGILIHCNLGQCRSVSVLVGFLMRYGFFRLRSAVQFTDWTIPGASIREEFMKVLKDYENYLYGELSVPTDKEEGAVSKKWAEIQREKYFRFTHAPAAFYRYMDKKLGSNKRPRTRGKIVGDPTGGLAVGDEYSSEEWLAEEISNMHVSGGRSEEEEFQLVL